MKIAAEVLKFVPGGGTAAADGIEKILKINEYLGKSTFKLGEGGNGVDMPGWVMDVLRQDKYWPGMPEAKNT